MTINTKFNKGDRVFFLYGSRVAVGEILFLRASTEFNPLVPSVLYKIFGVLEMLREESLHKSIEELVVSVGKSDPSEVRPLDNCDWNIKKDDLPF